jgi:peptidoglycan hydrolase-like protein with peptidoglycan-binding domain
MRIVISSGHGKHIRGARGNPCPPQLDEVDEARRVVEQIADYLQGAGIGVTTFHDDESTSQSENLDRIVDFHNSQDRDLDVSVHFNAYDQSAHGTEVLYVTQEALAADVSAAICEAGGFTNRGPKKRTDLAFLNGTDEPAILIETCFCDNTNDSNRYNDHFDAICRAIAAALSGEDIAPGPEPEPPEPEPEPPVPPRPDNIPVEDRPTLRRGDDGPHVLDLQRMIPRFTGEFDGDFGPTTEENVIRYQRTRALDVDGVVGQQTWQALYDHKLPIPPEPVGELTVADQAMIIHIANKSAIADYNWEDRGAAPTGYTTGMALSFAQTVLKLKANDPIAREMAKGRTNSDKDVLNLWRDEFEDLGMDNESTGSDTLRHLYAFMLGSGMRESSGQHCEGRDQSATNVESDTAEAGLFQTSYNASNASDPDFDNLMDQFIDRRWAGFLEVFSIGVSCSSSDWDNYGSGRGAQFQQLCKEAPAFAVETHALTLRNLCNHYGPVIRFEVELKREADEMFEAVQEYVDGLEPPATA